LEWICIFKVPQIVAYYRTGTSVAVVFIVIIQVIKSPIVRRLNYREINHITYRPPPRNRNSNWLMIHRRVDRSKPIIPRGQTGIHGRRQNAIDPGGIHSLEIRILIRVCRRRLIKPGQLFNRDMRMAKNVPICVECLRGSHVSAVWVRELAGVEMIDHELDGKILVLREYGKVLRVNEFRRGRVVSTRHDAQRGVVT